MPTANFEFSTWCARLTLASVPLVGAIVLAILAASVFGIVHGVALYMKLEAAVLMAVGLWMGASLWQWVRYRHALRTRYNVGTSGIQVTNESGTLFFSWVQCQDAKYFPLLGIIRVEPAGEPAPVVLFLARRCVADSASDVRNELARKYLANGLREKLTTRWIA